MVCGVRYSRPLRIDLLPWTPPPHVCRYPSRHLWIQNHRSLSSSADPINRATSTNPNSLTCSDRVPQSVDSSRFHEVRDGCLDVRDEIEAQQTEVQIAMGLDAACRKMHNGTSPVEPFSCHHASKGPGSTCSGGGRAAMNREPLLPSGQCRSLQCHCDHCRVSDPLDSAYLRATLVCQSMANCIPGGSAYMFTFERFSTLLEVFSNTSFFASAFPDASLFVFCAKRLIQSPSLKMQRIVTESLFTLKTLCRLLQTSGVFDEGVRNR